MKRTKSWWNQLSPSEKTELVMIERSGTFGQRRSPRHQELITKANTAEEVRIIQENLDVWGARVSLLKQKMQELYDD